MSEVAVVAESSTYEEIGMKAKEFEISKNECYENLPAKPVENLKEAKRDSLTADVRSTSKQMKCMFVMMAVLAVIVIGTCAALVAAFVEISKLSKNIAEGNDNIIAANVSTLHFKLENNTSANFSEHERENVHFEILYDNISMLQNTISEANNIKFTMIMQKLLELKNNTSANFTERDERANTLFQGLQSRDERANLRFEGLLSNISRLQNSNNLNTQYVMILNETLQQLLVYSSCADILQRLPSPPSGYYWIRSRDGSAVRVYCDMTRSCGGITGGWMRIAELDMTDNTTQCPDNLELNTTSSRRTCIINNTVTVVCSSTVYSANSVEYSKVCGRIRAYQVGTPDSFHDYGRGPNPGIEGNYVDGVSLTHGSSPREHVWTFAASPNEDGIRPFLKCPCINYGTSSPPAFVERNYFCDSAVTSGLVFTFHKDDPLWDGAGCGSNNMCCSFNNPPWFYKQLLQSTTDDIEMRVCRDQYRFDEDIGIELVEIFVQ